MARRYPEDENLENYPYYENLDDEEMDVFIAALARILIKHTDMNKEAVYALLFKNGDSITWH